MTDTPAPHIDNTDFPAVYRQLPGLIPYSLSNDRQHLIWIDLGQYHVYEGRYQLVEKAAPATNALGGDEAYIPFFQTDLSALDTVPLTDQHLHPTGFIFGVARCGSTLLTRALGRDRKTLSFGEPPLPSGLWQLTEKGGIANDEQTVERVHKIIRLMGRRRRADYCRMFIKFSAIENHAADILHAAFPSVPSLFLYRNPAEVLISQMDRPTGWLDKRHSAWGRFISAGRDCASTEEYYAVALAGFCKAALSDKGANWQFLNYQDLRVDRFSAILSALDATYVPAEIEAMKLAFSSYSKTEYRNVPFQPDQQRKLKQVTPAIREAVRGELTDLYEQLLTSPRNLFRSDRRRPLEVAMTRKF